MLEKRKDKKLTKKKKLTTTSVRGGAVLKGSVFVTEPSSAIVSVGSCLPRRRMFRIRRILSLSHRAAAPWTRNAASSSETPSLPRCHAPILPSPSSLGWYFSIALHFIIPSLAVFFFNLILYFFFVIGVGIRENHGSTSSARRISSKASPEQGKSTEKVSVSVSVSP